MIDKSKLVKKSSFFFFLGSYLYPSCYFVFLKGFKVWLYK